MSKFSFLFLKNHDNFIDLTFYMKDNITEFIRIYYNIDSNRNLYYACMKNGYWSIDK